MMKPLKDSKHPGSRVSLLRRSAEVLDNNGFDLSDLYYRMSSRKNAERFSAAGVGRLWRSFLKKNCSAPGGLLNVYINIPFCKTKCDFCQHFSKAGAGKEEVSGYTDVIIDQIRYFGKIFRNAKINNLFIGGTPSYLDARQLDRLFKSVFSEFAFTREGTRIFECAPSSMTFAKIAAAKKHGFTRIYMGVQTLNEKVLRAVNRPQKSSRVTGLIRRINESRFKHGSCVDLILGLYGEGPAEFLGSFSRIVKSGPETVAVYDLSPTGRYMEKFYDSDAAARNEIARVCAMAEAPMIEIAGKEGYVLVCRTSGREWLFCKKERLPQFALYSYDPGEFSPVPVSVLGIGSGARSLMWGCCGYTQDEGIARSFVPGAKVFSGNYLDKYGEMLKFLFMPFREGLPVSIDQFKTCFGEDLSVKFGESLAELEKMRYIKISGGQISLACTKPADVVFCGLWLMGMVTFLKEVLPHFPRHITRQILA